MKSSFIKIRKLTIGALILMGMTGIVSCGKGGEEGNPSTLTMEKDGSLRAEIVENFEKEYYDAGELQQTVLEEAASYNRSAGSGNITVEKVETDEGSVTVKMTYAGIEDYAAFNRAVFFVGTPGEAEAAGYNLNVVLSGVKDSQETVGRADILAIDGGTLLITNVKEGIAINGKALYVSENVTAASNARKVWYTGDEKGLAYVVYK